MEFVSRMGLICARIEYGTTRRDSIATEWVFSADRQRIPAKSLEKSNMAKTSPWHPSKSGLRLIRTGEFDEESKKSVREAR
jgi:hypothetical protein